jgi:hypothetical protein
MRRLVFAVSRITQRTVKAIPLPGLALLLALALVVVPNAAMPVPASAAIEQRGTATTGTSVYATLTIDKPPGVVAGDVMIVNIAKVGNYTTAPTSAGWTLIDGRSLGGVLRYGAVLYRVADGTEGESFTFALGTGTIGAVGSILAFSGVDTSGETPFDVAPGTISVQDSQAAVAAPSITTASANAVVIMFGQAALSNPTWSEWTTTSPGELTELYDSQIDGLTPASVGAAWGMKATAGDTGDGAATLSSAERNGGILIALKPVVAATTLTVSPTTGIYGGAVSLTATLSPALAGKTISFTLNGVSAGTADTDSNGVANIPAATITGIRSGSYPTGVAASFGGDTAYVSSSGAASLTVKPRDIEITAEDNGKTYGDADPALNYRISSGVLVDGDAFSGDLIRIPGEDAGSYAIQQGSLALSKNYTLTFIEGAFNIGLRPLVITADSLTKTCGDTTSFDGSEFTARGLAGSDNVTSVTLTSAGAAADAAEGSYPIVGSNAVGTGLANYAITYEDGTLRVVTVKSPPPDVKSVHPSQGEPGQNLRVVITGSNFNEVTSVSLGDGITIDSYTVDSSQQITADITIDSAAEPGVTDIVIATPSGDGLLTGSFAVGISDESSESRLSPWFWWFAALLAVPLALLLFARNRRTKNTLAPQQAPAPTPIQSLERSEKPVDGQPASTSPVYQSLVQAGKIEGKKQTSTPTRHQSLERTRKKAHASTPNQSVRRTTKKAATSPPKKSRRGTRKRTTD